MRHFLFAPKISTEQELHDQIVRIAWYLGDLDQCCFTIETELEVTAIAPEDYIDSSVESRIIDLKKRGLLNFCKKIPQRAWEGIIAWKGREEASLSLSVYTDIKEGSLPFYNVDSRHRMESSLYIDIANQISSEEIDVLPYQVRFRELAAKLKTQNAFLFCTGPSVAEYKNYYFGNGVSIICNSVIFDDDLLQATNPKILVFADPIFHFGCSSYAEKFRLRLHYVAEKYDLTIVIPIKYLNIFLSSSPHLAHRLIAVPYEKNIDVNLDLTNNFCALTTDNILTFLMMPVAGSMADNLFLLGCDGRKLEDDSYFWAHNEKTQINSEMENIQKAHPSFFKLDYNEYYIRHCENLEHFAAAAEEKDKRVIGLTFSYIDALNSRQYAYSGLNSKQTLYTSINPDLKDNFGHYYHYDLRVSETLPSDASMIVWGHAQSITPLNGLQVQPIFKNYTFEARAATNQESLKQFEYLLVNELSRLSLLKVRKIVYMYTGDVSHAQTIVDIARRSPELFVDLDIHINLFYFHFDFDVENRKLARLPGYQKVLLDSLELKDTPIKLYVDSRRGQIIADEIIGPGLREWPMIQVSSMQSPKVPANVSRKQSSVLRVFCPATGQVNKGYDLACKAILKVHALQHGRSDSIQFVLRDLLRDTDDNNRMIDSLLSQLKTDTNVEFLEGIVDDATYLNEYQKADVIVLPYRSTHFFSRTSSAVLDALYYAKPIVCVKDTWVEEQAQKFGLAFSFLDGDVESFVNKIIEATTTVNKVDPTAVHQTWLTEYAPSRLQNLLENCSRDFDFEEIWGREPERDIETKLRAWLHRDSPESTYV